MNRSIDREMALALATPGRLEALDRSGVLDAPPEEAFDRLTRLASILLNAPVALASFVTPERQFFAGQTGKINEPWQSKRETPLQFSFCKHVVQTQEPLVVGDARTHPLVKDNLARQELGVMAYAGVPIHAPDGEVLGSFCVIDAVPREWTEEQVQSLHDLSKALNTEIALRMELREQLRLKEAYREAKDEAEAATRAKSDFLARMSHEIRTPMNAIIGLTGVVLGSDLEPDQSEHLGLVQDSANALLQIINDILDLSRIEAGRLNLSEESFHLRETVQYFLKPLEFRARQQGLDFRLTIANDVPDAVEGDRGRLRQLLVNLVGNSLKFTERGSVSVEVLRETDANGSILLRFTVRDTGIGITREQAGRIFDPFSQADAQVYGKYGGTGLGLSISRHLAELMGGKIWVESEPGVGSAFHVTVRFNTTDAVPEASPAISPEEVAALPALTILLAEDNRMNQKLATLLLEGWGHRVRVAENGAEALEALRSEEFDLVLMDVQMPELDGLAATRARRDEEASEGAIRIPIVALTAHAMDGDRELCFQAGMDLYLSKPLRPAELQSTLAAAWRLRNAFRGSETA